MAFDLNTQMVAGYRNAINIRGQEVVFRRIVGQAPTVQNFDAIVQAIVQNYQVEPSLMPVEPEGSVTLGDKMILVLETDLRTQQFPLPLRKNDKVKVNDEWLNVETLDPNKRGLAGCVEVHAKGSK